MNKKGKFKLVYESEGIGLIGDPILITGVARYDRLYTLIGRGKRSSKKMKILFFGTTLKAFKENNLNVGVKHEKNLDKYAIYIGPNDGENTYRVVDHILAETVPNIGSILQEDVLEKIIVNKKGK